jgi:hypothetical protein
VIAALEPASEITRTQAGSNAIGSSRVGREIVHRMSGETPGVVSELGRDQPPVLRRTAFDRRRERLRRPISHRRLCIDLDVAELKGHGCAPSIASASAWQTSNTAWHRCHSQRLGVGRHRHALTVREGHDGRLQERLAETHLATLDHRHFSVVGPRNCPALTLLPD